MEFTIYFLAVMTGLVFLGAMSKMVRNHHEKKQVKEIEESMRTSVFAVIEPEKDSTGKVITYLAFDVRNDDKFLLQDVTLEGLTKKFKERFPNKSIVLVSEDEGVLEFCASSKFHELS